MERWLFLMQRITAMVLGPLVIIHLVLILFAVKGGLSGAEILARTTDNYWWGAFYALFVIAAAVHAPIGIRNILIEWTRLNKSHINLLCTGFAASLLIIGFRAIAAVI